MAYIRKEAGVPVDMWAAASIAKAFDRLNVAYPKTDKGAPSFTKSFLEGCEHPIAKAIVEVREINKTHNTFLQPYLDASEATGRIHSHINQLRGEGGGTVTGRLSMNQPNLQQVPATSSRYRSVWSAVCSCRRRANSGRPTTSARRSRGYWFTMPAC